MKKSTITCDMEGVIETMNEGAEKIFGYKKEELIGIKRVSIFSPGEIVLQNVANWLDTAVKNGIYEGETIFLNKNKEKINAKIRITPTFKNGKDNPQTGYCGVTEVIDKDVNVKINTSTNLIKWLAITRLPFTSASILPIFVIAAYFAFVGDDLFNSSALIFSLMGVIFAHLSVNVFNDYFDNLDGTDEKNTQYFQQVSGGSRAIELGLITLSKTKNLAYVLCLIAIIFGVLTVMSANSSNYFEIFLIAKASLSLGYYYTAPPFRLVSRRGLGELTIFLTFGPLLTLGAAFAIFDGDLMSSEHFINCLLLGVPMGLLTTNILLINQFPDAESDKMTGKNHLVVTFGKKKSRWIYLSVLVLTLLVSIYLAININYLIFVATAITGLFGFSIIKHLFKYYKSRELVKSNWNTILLQAVFCIILILTFLVQ